jgi:signal transduction histidine kinase
MAKFGEGYCWTIKDDPSVCPYIKPGEEYLLGDVKRRIQEKCIECHELRGDLKAIAEEKGSLFEAFPLILDELVKREQKLKKYGSSIKIKEEMFDMLVHLSTSLKLVLNLDEILYKGLVAFTTGNSFGFNRAIVLLSQNRKLRGYFALGPKDPEEAFVIWRDISEKNLTIPDLFRFSPDIFKKEKEKFAEVLRQMEFDINEDVFKRVFKTGMVLGVAPDDPNILRNFYPPGVMLRVSPEDDVPNALRSFYRDTPFWIVPLFSHLKRPLGAILLDNFLTRREVSEEELKAIEIFATEISLAIERGLTYEELEEKVETLEEANVKLREHQELIMKLREEASIGEMVLQLTHSFKNPVIAMAGLAKVLRKKTDPGSHIAKYTDAILEEAIKLEQTLKDFVNLVKTKYMSDKSYIDVNKVVELLYQEKRAKGKLQGVDFHLRLGENLPPVFENRYQLYNCIENVVNNSIEAMPEGGELFIETTAQDGFIYVNIRDTGPGIPADVMKNLFKPFFTTKTLGSGLGLYTSKEIIENMGGHIVVSCEREKGCSVTIKIPTVEWNLSGEKKEVNYEQGFSS